MRNSLLAFGKNKYKVFAVSQFGSYIQFGKQFDTLTAAKRMAKRIADGKESPIFRGKESLFKAVINDNYRVIFEKEYCAAFLLAY